MFIVLLFGMFLIIGSCLILCLKNYGKLQLLQIMMIAVGTALIFLSTNITSRGLPSTLNRLKTGEKYVVVVVYDEKYIITKSMANELLFVGPMKDISNFVVGNSYVYTSDEKLEGLR